MTRSESMKDRDGQLSRELPLNIILTIISYLDDVADVARVTRTSRLLYYMTLPRLYEQVTLRSYPSIRSVDGRPEGLGGGSPFCMALDGLISSGHASYTKRLRLLGSWKEVDVEDFSRGRVPDNTMILNVALKAVLDKMDKLEEFSWELNMKPMKSIYQGLSSRKTLSSLTLRFPSSRAPRPTVTIPPIPSLRSIYFIDIDPLCYPDDISLLLLHSRNVTSLKMHWSPRMRKDREPSVNLKTYFGSLMASGRKLMVKSFALANLYAISDSVLEAVLEPGQLETVSIINCADRDDPSTVFFDNTWGVRFDDLPQTNLRVLRNDTVNATSSAMITSFRGLREIYLVSRSDWGPYEMLSSGDSHGTTATNVTNNNTIGTAAPPPALAEIADGPVNTEVSKSQATTASDVQEVDHSIDPGENNGSINTSTESGNDTTPTAAHSLPISSEATSSLTALKPSVNLASDIIAAVTSHHGSTLTHFLLSDCWNLEREVIQHILSSCPKLEQLGLAFENDPLVTMRAVLPIAPNLKALRILLKPSDERWQTMQQVGPHVHTKLVQLEMWKKPYWGLKWFGLGRFAFELGPVVRRNDGPGWTRVVKYIEWERACEVKIFGMDSLDISL